MDNREVIFLKHVIEGPKVLGKIDLSKIDSSTRPKTISISAMKRITQLRDSLDSGWGWSFKQMKKNYKRKPK